MENCFSISVTILNLVCFRLLNLLKLKCHHIICYLDLLTVSETSNEPPQEEGINSPRNLALEATFINHNLSQQVLKMVREVV